MIRNTNMGTHNIDKKSDIFLKKDLGVKTRPWGSDHHSVRSETTAPPRPRAAAPPLPLAPAPPFPPHLCCSQLRPAPALSPASFFFRLSLCPTERGGWTPTLVGGAQGGAYAYRNRERSVLTPLVEIPDPGGAGRI